MVHKKTVVQEQDIYLLVPKKRHLPLVKHAAARKKGPADHLKKRIC
jgi:hypothetical protein